MVMLLLVFDFVRICARRDVFDRPPLGLTVEPMRSFAIALLIDGLTGVVPPDGRTGVTDLTFDAIHAK